MTASWPTSHGALLLWAELLLAWVVANYVIGTVPIPGRLRPNGRANAEIGTLVSLAVAFVVGILMRTFINALW
jgi:hypothetical protein